MGGRFSLHAGRSVKEAISPCLGALCFFEYPGQPSVSIPSVLEVFRYLPRVTDM